MSADQVDTETLQQLAERVSELDATEAVQVIERAIDAFPRDARLRFLRGSLQAEARGYDAALNDFGLAIQLDPRFAIARFQLGLLLLCLGRAGDARQVWEPLDLLDEADCLRILKRGLCLLADERLAESVAMLRAGQNANQTFPPLNKDMELLIERAVSRMESGTNRAPDEGIHILLSGYLDSTTKH